MLTKDEREYYEGLARQIGYELDAFHTYILPEFVKRGYSLGQALAYHSNKQIEEAIDCLSVDIERISVDDGTGNSDGKEPWQN